MKKGHLSEYFSGIAAKTLSAVEADSTRSNQHEFNGIAALKRIFGQAHGKQRYYATFLYLTDDEPVIADSTVTWYDAREAHPVRSEHRLYFPSTEVTALATEGDLLVIGKRQDGTVLILIAQAKSTIANQVAWLFGISGAETPGFTIQDEQDSDKKKLEFSSRMILEKLGIAQQEAIPDYLDIILGKFGKSFPPTRVFSEFARSTLKDVDPCSDPDAALMAWMEREEMLFRTLERHIVEERLLEGFENDVDGFISFSLSVQNRRKSRVGSALENHIEEIFRQNGIRVDRDQITENKSRPDFIFPGIKEYHDSDFPADKLLMLGVKSTSKDRWRQVLAEADRIKSKHLLTLEPGISSAQTDEMRSKQLNLVLPSVLHSSYSPDQQAWILSLNEFISLVRASQ